VNWQGIEEFLRQGVDHGVYPGASLGVLKLKGPTLISCAGKTSEKNGTLITNETRFDLASLTKVFATASICARLCERGVVDLDERIVSEFPELLWHPDWKETKVREVLVHQAGFMGWVDFALELFARDLNRIKDSGEVLKGMLSHIAQSPASYPAKSKTIYSDLGFIVLGCWLERKIQKSLSELLINEVCLPIKMKDFTFNPLHDGASLNLITATEDIRWRGGLIHGVVHDDNAFIMGGVAGHAGIFGSVEDCLKMGHAWLEAIKKGNSFLSKIMAETFTTPVVAADRSQRALGWDTPIAIGSSAGSLISKRSIGHLGYTGTSIWIDLVRETVVVLLTNRVHPTSKNDSIRTFRPKLHDMIWKMVGP